MKHFLEKLRQQAVDCPELMQVFENCYTNTLDKAVQKKEDGTVHVITGDIPAMWLRDSAAQMRPYLFLAKENEEIQELIAGVVRRQFMYICIDEYANAFNGAPNGASWETDDQKQDPWVWSGNLRWIPCAIPCSWLIFSGRIRAVIPSSMKILSRVLRRSFKCFGQNSFTKKNLPTGFKEKMPDSEIPFPERGRVRW